MFALRKLTQKVYFLRSSDLRLVNWCSALRSTISDIEVDHVEVKPNQKIDGVNVGCMHQFAYPIDGGTLLWAVFRALEISAGPEVSSTK